MKAEPPGGDKERRFSQVVSADAHFVRRLTLRTAVRLLSSTTFVGVNGFQAVLCVAGGLVFIAVGVNAREWGLVAASLIWFAGAAFLVSIGRQHWEVWLEADGVRVRRAKTQADDPLQFLGASRGLDRHSATLDQLGLS